MTRAQSQPASLRLPCSSWTGVMSVRWKVPCGPIFAAARFTSFLAGQLADIKRALADISGKSVHVELDVDPSLIGGLVVKLGSRMIDTSLKTKLDALKIALKEVG